MIISRTPFRVSLFGGGSDYPAWYRRHGGAVLGFALDKYCYITLRRLPPFFEHRHRIVYSRIETVRTIEEIQHPAVRHVLLDRGVDFGVEIHHDGDLPARSGLGSSSSFTVGLLNAIYAWRGQMATKRELAAEAIRIEQTVIKEHVGSQDQIWAAYGGINRIDFFPDDTFGVTPLVLGSDRRQALFNNMLLFFTGFSRCADWIAEKKIANLAAKESQLRRMVELVDEAVAILTHGNHTLDGIGGLLHEGWMLKRSLAEAVSTAAIDEIYATARAAGAIGGKLLGAGGGGFILFYVPPERQAEVRQRLCSLIEVAVAPDYSGSKIVVYQPHGLP